MPNPVIDANTTGYRKVETVGPSAKEILLPAAKADVRNLDAAYRRNLGSEGRSAAVVDLTSYPDMRNSMMRLAPPTPYWNKPKMSREA
ncbi:MAG TPA: hypothetical protein VG820_09460 [Fimbriimonadaceae bacterium]|nr:hypothetical protein [Fimbriimonadaceae bacterium]